MKWAAIGFLGLAVGVAAGAFGAHGLQDRLDPQSLTQWMTAVRYWTLAALALAILGIAAHSGVTFGIGPALIAIGGLVFAVAVSGLALGGPRWFGAIAPLGGTSMILGFGLTAWTLWRRAGGPS